MNANSTKGTLAASSPRLSLPDDGDLERSCKPACDGITVAAPIGGIERIEARFHGEAFKPHRHDTYALGLTLHGIQTFRYRGEDRASAPGNVIVLHPDEIHDGGAGTEDGLRYRMIYLPPEKLTDALGGNRPLPFIASPVVADIAFATHVADVVADLEGTPGELQMNDALAGIADALLRHADTPAYRRPIKTDMRAIRRACDYLQAHADRQVGSGELEAETGLDRFSLARQFRAALGTSPHRYLTMRRLDRAKALIRGGMGLAETAVEAGFADQAHFSRQFKKAVGMTPGRWALLSRAAFDHTWRDDRP